MLRRGAGRRRRLDKSAIVLLEEATSLLREAPLMRHLEYALGTLPFVLAFLYFWADMSKSADAVARLESASVMLAALFVWMKYWQAEFAGNLLAHVSGEGRAAGGSALNRLRIVSAQCALQPTGFILLPLAALAILPFAWVYAFYLNLTVYGADPGGLQSLMNRAAARARDDTRQNHMTLLVLFFFSLVVFLNVSIGMYLLPMLLKIFFGVESFFTQGIWGPLNTTFLVVACCLTYLLCDPLLKAAYVLRCFYGDSRHTGRDLRVTLAAALPHVQDPALRQRSGSATGVRGTLVALLFLSISLCASALHADTPATDIFKDSGGGRGEVAPVSATQEELSRSLDRVLEDRRFNWRFPRQKSIENTTEKPGIIVTFLRSTLHAIKDLLSPAGQWIGTQFKRLVRWLSSIRWRPEGGPTSFGSGGLGISPDVLLLIVLLVVASVLGIVLFRSYKKKRALAKVSAVSLGFVPPPDLQREDVSPDALPVNEWLALSQELFASGQTRLALRALYLAGLSHLSGRGLITVAGYKSNREYVEELRRRSHVLLPGTLDAFVANVRSFEFFWYGMHEITAELVQGFRDNQQRLLSDHAAGGEYGTSGRVEG